MRYLYWLMAQVYAGVGWCFYSGGRVQGIALKLNSVSYQCWRKYYLAGRNRQRV